jgi:hypothetical protein
VSNELSENEKAEIEARELDEDKKLVLRGLLL